MPGFDDSKSVSSWDTFPRGSGALVAEPDPPSRQNHADHFATGEFPANAKARNMTTADL